MVSHCCALLTLAVYITLYVKSCVTLSAESTVYITPYVKSCVNMSAESNVYVASHANLVSPCLRNPLKPRRWETFQKHNDTSFKMTDAWRLPVRSIYQRDKLAMMCAKSQGSTTGFGAGKHLRSLVVSSNKLRIRSTWLLITSNVLLITPNMLLIDSKPPRISAMPACISPSMVPISR